MWRGQGRSFDRSADAASWGYEQWSQQTRGDPERAAALQAQQVAMGMTAQPPVAAPAPMAPTGMYAPAPAGTTAAPVTFQQRFGAGATGYQQYDAGSIAAIDAAAGAGRFSAATMWASQGPSGLAQAPHAGMSTEVTRRIFELGRAAMMREEQEARGATVPALEQGLRDKRPATAAPTQLMTPQQLAMNAPNATAPPTVTETGASSGSTSTESETATRRRVESPPKATDAEVEDITPWPTQYFRPLSDKQALVQARLQGTALTEVFAGTVVVTPWPGEQWLSVARNCCRGSTGMRSARVNSWRDARLGALVLTKMMVSYVMGTDMPATDLSYLEKMRDGLIRALPWAFDVHVDDDDDWPDPGQHTGGDYDARLVARRLAWF